MGNNKSTSEEAKKQSSEAVRYQNISTSRTSQFPQSRETSLQTENINSSHFSNQNNLPAHLFPNHSSDKTLYQNRLPHSSLQTGNINSTHFSNQNNLPAHLVSNRSNGKTLYQNRLPHSSTSQLDENDLFIDNTRTENKSQQKEVSHEIPTPDEKSKNTMDTLVLLELSGKDTFYIVRQLKDNKSLFENSVQGPISDSLLIVMMKIVRKICFTDSYHDKIEFLKIICCENFLNALGNYIINLPTHQKDCAKEDLLFLEESVLSFFESVLNLIPELVCVKLRDLLIKTNLAINGLEQYQNLKIDDSIKMKLKNMESAVRHHLSVDSSEVKQRNQLSQQSQDQTQVKSEQRNLRGAASQKNSQSKHISFLTSHVFPNMIKKLDVPAYKVRGMRKNIYFIESGEKKEGNVKEDEFLVALAQYLLKQHYTAKSILLLTRSEMKMKYINELKSNVAKLEDMAVGIIDASEKFDATIVLISLAVDESGDTKQNIYEERQLCKALLGAKNGIYMIGNSNTLEDQGQFWKEMISLLRQYEAVSSTLPLLCEFHQIVITVSSPEDFNKFKNSGCSRRCEQKLQCGHQCKRLCHFDDRQHKNYKCRERCLRKPALCSFDHKCFKLCHEACELCSVSVTIDGMKKLCHELHNTKNPILDYSSLLVVSDRNKHVLPCSHVTFKESLSELHLDMWSVELVTLCEVPCSATLPCGHVCTGTCGSCRQGRVHMPCRDRSKRTLACGHRILKTCSSVEEDCVQKCFYECPHGKCKEKCGIPCTPCKEMCTIGCEHSQCTKKCFEICDRRPCFEPCKNMLACGHRCIGICGEPCPPGPENCRVCNADKLKKKDSSGGARFVLLSNCNHVVRSNDLDRRAFSKQHKVETLTCPICGYNITKTLRYINYAKQLQRNLVTIRHVHKKYKENLTAAFWSIAKEIQSLSLPKEIQHHNKIDEIQKHFQLVKNNQVADHKTTILLMFLRNLLYPVVHGQAGTASPNHLDWFLYLLLERYEMGLCSQVVRELYKEIVEYQKMKGKVYKQYMLELHKAIAFFIFMERSTWIECDKGHLSSVNSLITECSTCDSEKIIGKK